MQNAEQNAQIAQNAEPLRQDESSNAQNDFYARQEQSKKNAIKNFCKALSQEQKIAQLFIIGIEGSTELHSYAKKEFFNKAPAAFLLFKPNIADTAEKVIAFTSDIFNWFCSNNLTPPLLLMDNEGGSVYRLEDLASPLPSQQQMAQKLSVEQAERYYALIAEQMAALGLHVNLSPIAEPLTAQNEKFLQTRSFGTVQNAVSYSKAAVKAYQNANISAVVKHFPGNTNADPHDGLPHLKESKEDFFAIHVEPFKQLLLQDDAQNNLQDKSVPYALLLSHAVVDALDKTPSCLSSIIVQNLVRQQLNFDGVIMSDDIFMGALVQNGYPPEKVVVDAIKAGVDLLMMSEKHFGKEYQALFDAYTNDELLQKKVDEALERIILLKIKLGLLRFDFDDDGMAQKVCYAEPLPQEQMLLRFTRAKNAADNLYATWIK